MKKNFSVIAIVVVLAALFVGILSVQADGVKTLIVGFDQNFPPYGYVGEDGEYTGYDLELAAEAAKRMELEIVYQPIDWDAKDLELDSGTIDCIWNGFTMNNREDKYTWTEAYKGAGQVFLLAADSGVTDYSGLKGKVVAVQTDSAGLYAIQDEENKDLLDSFKELLVIPQYNEAFMELESGAIDAIILDIDVAKYQIEGKEDKYLILDEFLQKEEYGVGFKLGNTELRDKVQVVLDEMAKDGVFAELSEKYFSYDSCIMAACQPEK
jgi:polar amino acid transport system substrate-binding protein